MNGLTNAIPLCKVLIPIVIKVHTETVGPKSNNNNLRRICPAINFVSVRTGENLNSLIPSTSEGRFKQSTFWIQLCFWYCLT